MWCLGRLPMEGETNWRKDLEKNPIFRLESATLDANRKLLGTSNFAYQGWEHSDEIAIFDVNYAVRKRVIQTPKHPDVAFFKLGGDQSKGYTFEVTKT